MIRIEREPEFWENIARHPACRFAIKGMTPEQVGLTVQHPAVTPFATDHGGWVFSGFGGVGLVVELHALYEPAGWGKEAAQALKEALCIVFRTAHVVVAYQVAANPHSRAPLSFGFVDAGEWQATRLGVMRAMVLTRTAWESSPAHRRHMRRN